MPGTMYIYTTKILEYMSCNPMRSWSVILQQAWALRLRDKISSGGAHVTSQGSGGHRDSKFNEPCKWYNRGHCSFGANCCYDHKCSYCFKTGHTILNCRKLMADKEHALNKDKRRDSGKFEGQGHGYHHGGDKHHTGGERSHSSNNGK